MCAPLLLPRSSLRLPVSALDSHHCEVAGGALCLEHNLIHVSAIAVATHFKAPSSQLRLTATIVKWRGVLSAWSTVSKPAARSSAGRSREMYSMSHGSVLLNAAYAKGFRNTRWKPGDAGFISCSTHNLMLRHLVSEEVLPVV